MDYFQNLFAEDLDKLGIIKNSDFKYADIKTSISSRGSIDPSDPVKNKTFYNIDIFNSNLTSVFEISLNFQGNSRPTVSHKISLNSSFTFHK